ncbi:MAG TPA: acyl carrier protein, partial [Kofleriaceae bacterium]|nr:acyl carrier protein [Kofleriaceae bacterium]
MPAQDEIIVWLRAAFARRAEIAAPDIDLDAPFADFGLPSRELVGLSGELQDWLGRRIPPTVFWDHPTIRTLSTHLV